MITFTHLPQYNNIVFVLYFRKKKKQVYNTSSLKKCLESRINSYRIK